MRVVAVTPGFDGVSTVPAAVTGEPIEALADYGVVTTETVERYRDALEAVFAGRHDEVTVQPAQAPGSARVVETTVAPISRGGAVVGGVVSARDVTDCEEREQQIAASNERLDMALSNTGAGVHEWDIDDDCVYWHETTSRLFGLDPETNDRTPSDCIEQVHPDDREDVLDAVDAAMETDGHLSVEFRVNDPGDPPRWFRSEGEFQYDDGEATRLVGTVTDVTARKRRERELVERERRLRAVIESSADTIAMQDTEGYYRVVNEAFVDVAGGPRSTVCGVTPAAVFDAETARKLERHRRAVLESERARVAEERIRVGGGPPSRPADRRAPLRPPRERRWHGHHRERHHGTAAPP
jgi:PAS domain-containing protein